MGGPGKQVFWSWWEQQAFSFTDLSLNLVHRLSLQDSGPQTKSYFHRSVAKYLLDIEPYWIVVETVILGSKKKSDVDSTVQWLKELILELDFPGSRFCRVWPLWPWSSHLPPLSLDFLICNIWIIVSTLVRLLELNR